MAPGPRALVKGEIKSSPGRWLRPPTPHSTVGFIWVGGYALEATGSPGPATHVLDLRCALYGNQFDQIWDQLNQSDYLRIRLLESPDQATKAA